MDACRLQLLATTVCVILAGPVSIVQKTLTNVPAILVSMEEPALMGRIVTLVSVQTLGLDPSVRHPNKVNEQQM